MPTPVIANVYRCTFAWNRANGVEPRNTIHVQADSFGHTDADVAAAIFSALPSHWAYPCSSAARLLGFEITKLDGVSATTLNAVADTGGEQSGDIVPASAAVISIKTGLKGPAHRGRVYLGPLAEGVISNGELNSTSINDLLVAWNAFFASLVAGSPSLIPGVASYKHATFTGAANLSVSSFTGTQRRRQKQVG